MIHFEKIILNNGLTVIANECQSSPLAAMNIIYKVGARDEDENKTGFAHLFEHLMFGGSVNIPDYDKPLQRAGGENNAFTNNDFTNYYLTLPARNIETAFWLESDRMLGLAFSENSLDVQRQVVSEEFRQRYLNQPYGDAWLHLRPLAYKVHPYKWNTIGKEISHIESATLEDVKAFFYEYYVPSNAILSVSGNIKTEEVFRLAEKWFGSVPDKPKRQKKLPQEPIQSEKRQLTLVRDVPAIRVFKAFHCCGRTDREFYATDLLTDILSNGKSSRLYEKLVKEKKFFNHLHAYMMGEMDKSLVVVEGMLPDGVDVKEAESALDEQLYLISNEQVAENEMTKAKQMVEAAIVFSELTLSGKAYNLGFFEMLGDASQVNNQFQHYAQVDVNEIRLTAKNIFNENNSSVLYYCSENK